MWSREAIMASSATLLSDATSSITKKTLKRAQILFSNGFQLHFVQLVYAQRSTKVDRPRDYGWPSENPCTRECPGYMIWTVQNSPRIYLSLCCGFYVWTCLVSMMMVWICLNCFEMYVWKVPRPGVWIIAQDRRQEQLWKSWQAEASSAQQNHVTDITMQHRDARSTYIYVIIFIYRLWMTMNDCE